LPLSSKFTGRATHLCIFSKGNSLVSGFQWRFWI